MDRHEKLAALIFRDMSADLARYSLAQITHAIDVIHDYDPYAIGFMEKVLVTGPKAARYEAANKLASITENIAEALETGESFRDRCRRTLGTNLINTVMIPWGVQCILDEYKEVEAYRILMGTDKARFTLRLDEPELTQYPVNFEKWRGLAALGATRISGGPEQLKRFIEYAGSANNIAEVIGTARERKTLDTAIIDAVLTGSESAALRSGAL